MQAAKHIYHHNEQELHGYLAYSDSNNTPRPAVIVAHDWSGRGEFACQKAKMLAEMGYVGFAADVYGQGRTGVSLEEKQALMQPLVDDRLLLRDRLRAAYEALLKLPQVDNNRIAIIGFCFGGLCALDLARSGADIKGAVSFHGLFGKPDYLKTEHINAKILALHGYEDPLANPEQVNAFCQEMTAAKADWQLHLYGHVQHAFTNPTAHDKEMGLIYNPLAAQRSWLAMSNFLQEIFSV